jgi:Schlafen, AlbA_2
MDREGIAMKPESDFHEQSQDLMGRAGESDETPHPQVSGDLPRSWRHPGQNPDFIDKILRAALRSGSEGEEYDFKRELDLGTSAHRYKLIKSVASFTNSLKGGFLFIGISDDAEVVGVPDSHLSWFDRTRFTQLLACYLTPVPILEIHRRKLAGAEVVIIQVEPFREIPSFISRPLEVGGRRLTPGTILVRNARAESRAATEEFEIRKLCRSIAERQADLMAGAIQRALRGQLGTLGGDFATTRGGAIGRARYIASRYWPEGDKAFIEVYFHPFFKIGLSHDDMRALFPAIRISSRKERFPYWRSQGWEGPSLRSEGWLGSLAGAGKNESDTLWVLTTDGAFLQRQSLDAPCDGVSMRVGMQRVATQVMLTFRLMRRFAERLGFSKKFSAYVGIRVSGIKDAILAPESRQLVSDYATCLDEKVEVRRPVSIEALEENPIGFVSSFLADFSWEMERTELVAKDWRLLIHEIGNHVDKECRFPPEERVGAWFDPQF